MNAVFGDSLPVVRLLLNYQARLPTQPASLPRPSPPACGSQPPTSAHPDPPLCCDGEWWHACISQADTRLRNDEGRSALELAEQDGLADIAKLIRLHARQAWPDSNKHPTVTNSRE